jgi:hypothetical protein
MGSRRLLSAHSGSTGVAGVAARHQAPLFMSERSVRNDHEVIEAVRVRHRAQAQLVLVLGSAWGSSDTVAQKQLAPAAMAFHAFQPRQLGVTNVEAVLC